MNTLVEETKEERMQFFKTHFESAKSRNQYQVMSNIIDTMESEGFDEEASDFTNTLPMSVQAECGLIDATDLEEDF